MARPKGLIQERREEMTVRKWDLPSTEEMNEQQFTDDERFRVGCCEAIQEEIRSDDKEEERKRLEAKYG
jgi:hypothetical protein